MASRWKRKKKKKKRFFEPFNEMRLFLTVLCREDFIFPVINTAKILILRKSPSSEKLNDKKEN